MKLTKKNVPSRVKGVSLNALRTLNNYKKSPAEEVRLEKRKVSK